MMNKVLKKTVALTLALATVVTGVLVTNVTEVKAMARVENASPQNGYAVSFNDINTHEYKMWRLYNPNSGEHFYTSSNLEMVRTIQSHWVFEGVGWVAPETSAETVHRLYNPNSGEHFYTTSNLERDNLVSYGWNYEGIGWNSSTDNNAIPVYRLFNPNATACSHHYTQSEAERDMLSSIGWVYEGVGWFANTDSNTVAQEFLNEFPIDNNAAFPLNNVPIYVGEVGNSSVFFLANVGLNSDNCWWGNDCYHLPDDVTMYHSHKEQRSSDMEYTVVTIAMHHVVRNEEWGSPDYQTPYPDLIGNIGAYKDSWFGEGRFENEIFNCITKCMTASDQDAHGCNGKWIFNNQRPILDDLVPYCDTTYAGQLFLVH